MSKKTWMPRVIHVTAVDYFLRTAQVTQRKKMIFSVPQSVFGASNSAVKWKSQNARACCQAKTGTLVHTLHTHDRIIQVTLISLEQQYKLGENLLKRNAKSFIGLQHLHRRYLDRGYHIGYSYQFSRSRE